MDVEYRCNLEDYPEAQTAHLRRSVGYYVLLVGGGVCLLFGAMIALTTAFSKGVPLLLLAAFWLGYAFIFLPLKIKRDFGKNPNFSRVCRLHADEDGLRSEGEVSSGETKWAAFTKSRETANLFMLFFGLRVFKVIPKRAFSASQQEEFRELLRRKLPAKQNV